MSPRSSPRLAIDDPVEPYVAAALPQPSVDPALAVLRREAATLRSELAQAQRKLLDMGRLADQDALTSVLNRRAFVRELNRTIAFCRRYKADASVVFFDLDGFKAVNDRHGHAAGDAALLTVAATLMAHVRESDVVGRMGGDEFAVILAQADRAAGEAKAASLAEAIEGAPAVVEGRAIPLRTSWGVRTLEDGLDAAQLLAEADAAMFVRKGLRRGGNVQTLSFTR